MRGLLPSLFLSLFTMHESTLDLFCENDPWAESIEEQAAALEVTCDYFISEFLVYPRTVGELD